MNNLGYFEYSKFNLDELIDLSNQNGVLVVSDNDGKETALMKANDKLISLIDHYESLKENSSRDNETDLKDTIIEIIDLVERTKNINYSPFCVYFQVLNFSYNLYMNTIAKKKPLEFKIALMKDFVELYIQNRHKIYKKLGYSNLVLQVNSDLASSRRKGKKGIEKVESVILPMGFKKLCSYEEFEKYEKGYLLPDKGDLELFNEILANKNIKFRFRETKQGKNPDMLLKIGEDIIILEHKLTSDGGGSQNSELNEIIQFIDFGEQNSHLHYVSLLQGNYFSKFASKHKEPKVLNQHNDILRALNDYKQNYFVSGSGFIKLVNEFVDGLKNE